MPKVKTIDIRGIFMKATGRPLPEPKPTIALGPLTKEQNVPRTTTDTTPKLG